MAAVAAKAEQDKQAAKQKRAAVKANKAARAKTAKEQADADRAAAAAVRLKLLLLVLTDVSMLCMCLHHTVVCSAVQCITQIMLRVHWHVNRACILSVVHPVVVDIYWEVAAI